MVEMKFSSPKVISQDKEGGDTKEDGRENPKTRAAMQHQEREEIPM